MSIVITLEKSDTRLSQSEVVRFAKTFEPNMDMVLYDLQSSLIYHQQRIHQGSLAPRLELYCITPTSRFLWLIAKNVKIFELWLRILLGMPWGWDRQSLPIVVLQNLHSMQCKWLCLKPYSLELKLILYHIRACSTCPTSIMTRKICIKQVLKRLADEIEVVKFMKCSEFTMCIGVQFDLSFFPCTSIQYRIWLSINTHILACARHIIQHPIKSVVSNEKLL